jgi:hypothetical protein
MLKNADELAKRMPGNLPTPEFRVEKIRLIAIMVKWFNL